MSLSLAAAQSGVSLVGASYSAPASFEVSPGQVVTLFFTGIKPYPDGKLRSAKADTQTPPTTLAGLSARVNQIPALTNSIAVPFFAVRQENQCGDTQPVNAACVLTAIRVQIPYELSLQPSISADGQSGAAALAQFVLDEDGQPGKSFPLQPVLVSGHVLTTCDLDWDANPNSTCSRLAFHSDGRRVNASAPAKPGEVLTTFAYGLGPVFPAIETGKPAPSGAEIPQSGVLRVWVNLRNEPLNASASVPRHYDDDASNHPGDALRFAGLAPGLVGIYQLNFAIPTSFATHLSCGPEVQANALALITTRQGSESLPLCVER